MSKEYRSPLPPLARYPLDGLREVVEVNVVAPLALFQATAELLRAAPGGGRVVMITSDAAAEAYPGWGGYGAAKAALVNLTKALSQEFGHSVPAPRYRIAVAA